MDKIKKIGQLDQTLTKNKIIELAKADADGIINNEKFDKLKTYVELKRYEHYLTELINLFKTAAYEQIAQLDQDSVKIANAMVKKIKRTKWDFSSDEKWYLLDSKIKEFNDERKQHEAYLKQNNPIIEKVDTETGEIISVPKYQAEVEYGIMVKF